MRSSRDWGAGMLTILQESCAAGAMMKSDVAYGESILIVDGPEVETFKKDEPHVDEPFRSWVEKSTVSG